VDRPQVVARRLKDHLTAREVRDYAKLKKELHALERLPVPGRVLALSVNHCTVPAPPTHVLIRGNAHARGAPVEPAFPSVLRGPAPQIAPAPADARSSGRRTALAEWLASPKNPLTARVIVNRIWQHHFGRGIVATPNDFGKFGVAPSHPELLDWLASEFTAGGWKLKSLHRLLMNSSAYRMSSRGVPDGLRVDPENVLLWRFNGRRLTAEEVRDATLAVSGRLNRQCGGPGVYPPLAKEVLAGQSRPGEGWGQSSPTQASRRSVYIYVKRSLVVPVLAQHDLADTDSSCPVRHTTTVPTQALGLLNGDFANEQAVYLAERLEQEAPGRLGDQVRAAVRLVAGRSATAEEVSRDLDFIRRLQVEDGLTGSAALRHYCLLTLNANEFVYLD
jgi:hypothetical protein